MRGWATVPMVVLTGIVAACGWGSDGEDSNALRQRDVAGETTAAASERERALGLTRRLRAAYRRVCERQARAAPVAARSCPPLVPAGSVAVLYRGRSLGRDSAGGGFSAELASRALNRLNHTRIDSNGALELPSGLGAECHPCRRRGRRQTTQGR